MALDPADTIAIQQLYAAYNHAADRGDGTAFGGCFTPDGRFDMGGSVAEGFDAISKFAEQIPVMMPGARHIVTNILLQGDGDRATGRAYLMLVGTKSAPPAIAMTGSYEDRLVRAGNEWRFSERVFTADTP